MTEVKVCSFPPDLSLAPVEHHLSGMNVKYRIQGFSDRQDLYVDDSALPQVTHLLDQLTASSRKQRNWSLEPEVVRGVFLRAPVTYCLIFLSILGFCSVELLDLNINLVSYLTFTEIKFYASYIVSNDLQTTYLQGLEWWRLVTPIFLHFGIFHIMFNSLAALEFGRRLEITLPTKNFLLAVLIIGVGSNLAQYMCSESSMFGGLSGVVYGMFGMLLSLYRRSKIPQLKIPTGFAIMIFATLMLGPLGAFEFLFGVAVADQAHFAGLFLGLIVGFFIPYRSDLSS